MAVEKIAPHDTWSEIVRLVGLQRDQFKKSNALLVTAAWAKAVRSYWDNVVKEEAKAKAIEERRSKLMAKEVLRMVLVE